MFVWILRYSYTIGCTDSSSCLGYKVETDKTSLSSTTPGAIDIKFVSRNTVEKYNGHEENVEGKSSTYTYSTTDTEEERIIKREEANNWYTHPAFWWDKNCNNIWDKDENLSGIWIGKFETTGNEMLPMILPNATSLIGKNVSKQFEIAQKFRNDTSTYGLTGGISHMMKNSEWGAVAYLSQSIYGKYGNPNYKGANKEIYINNSSDMYTGRSGGTPSASFEPNGTYKYDDTPTSGGAWEYVMGNYNDGANQITGSSGFGTEEKPWPAKNYFDAYKTTTPFAKKDETTNGGALAETYNWYGDYSSSFINGKVWLNRGGVYSNLSNAGVFYGSTNTGSSSSAGSFRVSFISAS